MNNIHIDGDAVMKGYIFPQKPKNPSFMQGSALVDHYVHVSLQSIIPLFDVWDNLTESLLADIRMTASHFLGEDLWLLSCINNSVILEERSD
jgi:hypothetical protein